MPGIDSMPGINFTMFSTLCHIHPLCVLRQKAFREEGSVPHVIVMPTSNLCNNMANEYLVY